MDGGKNHAAAPLTPDHRPHILHPGGDIDFTHGGPVDFRSVLPCDIVDGAGRGKVLGMILRQGTVLAAIGIGVGLLIAAAVARGLSLFLFGMNPYDPATFATVAFLLLCSGIVATYFPARRATKVDPVEALRSE